MTTKTGKVKLYQHPFLIIDTGSTPPYVLWEAEPKSKLADWKEGDDISYTLDSETNRVSIINP